MKIGVVTVHDSANFGSFLQAFALHKVLENMGHSVYFIKTRNKKYLLKLFINFPGVKNLINHPINSINKMMHGYKKWRMFLKDIKILKQIEYSKDTLLDKIILGSDEIWNISTPVFQRKIFYGVGMNNVITYAVSIGKASIDDFENFPELTDAIARLGQVLVRDKNTYEMAQRYGTVEPIMVCDPTFLIPVKEFYRPYANKFIDNNKFILIYSYSIDKQLKDNIIKFSKEYNLKIVSACFKFEWADYNLNCSPIDFCDVLRKADYVVTTTFHGSIFSILNHKKFLVVPFSPKVKDLLKKVDLSYLVHEQEGYMEFRNKLVELEINYEEVDKSIYAMRDFGINALKHMLEK